MSRVKRLVHLFSAVALVAGIAIQLMPPGTAQAAAPPPFASGTRSLTLEDNTVGAVTTGGSFPGGTVKHLFDFTLSNTYQLGSITFQYCTTAEAVDNGVGCVAPAGLALTGATQTKDAKVSDDSDLGFTNIAFSTSDDAGDSANNVIRVSRNSASSLTDAATEVQFEFTGVVNPSAANTTFFVRIAAFSSLDGSGSPAEGGTVAASTANAIQLQGTMPESLVFCTGETVSETNSVPDCTTATAGSIQFNQLFSPVSTAISTSQMAASTNAGSGYAITVGGPTLTSGGNTIDAMTTADQSKYGVSQFGLNLVANDGSAYTNAPKVDATTLPAGYAASSDVTPTSGTVGTHYYGQPLTGFDTNGTFKFDDSGLNNVADSGYGTDPDAPKGTDAQIYTVSYIANVPGSLPAGTYATTLTYICTPTF